MKKIVLVLAVLLIAVPALAEVKITIVDEGDGVAAINYDATSEDPNLVRAFALDIKVTAGVIDTIYDFKIGESNDVEPGYGIFMGSIEINEDGEVLNFGNPVAPVNSPGFVGILGEPNITIELGALYYDDVNSPDASGVLCRVTVTEDCNMCITENQTRGGIVMENLSPVDVNLPCDFPVLPGCQCFGDIADSNMVIGPDGRVDTGDMGALLMELIGGGNPGQKWLVPSPSADLVKCMDIADSNMVPGPDTKIDTGDMGLLLMHLIGGANPGDKWEAGCMP